MLMKICSELNPSGLQNKTPGEIKEFLRDPGVRIILNSILDSKIEKERKKEIPNAVVENKPINTLNPSEIQQFESKESGLMTKNNPELTITDNQIENFLKEYDGIWEFEGSLEEQITGLREFIRNPNNEYDIQDVNELLADLNLFLTQTVNQTIESQPEIGNQNLTSSFQGYKGGFDAEGEETQEGDGKDKAMREIATGFIGELVFGEKGLKSSTKTSASFIGKKTKQGVSPEQNSYTINAGLIEKGSIIMLARNSEFSKRELEFSTKRDIRDAIMQGVKFVVGDIPDVDTQFIEYLKEMGADFTVYHIGDKSRIDVDKISVGNQSLTDEDYNNVGLSYNEVWKLGNTTYTFFKTGDIITGGFTSNGAELGYGDKAGKTYEDVKDRGVFVNITDMLFNKEIWQQNLQYRGGRNLSFINSTLTEENEPYVDNNSQPLTDDYTLSQTEINKINIAFENASKRVIDKTYSSQKDKMKFLADISVLTNKEVLSVNDSKQPYFISKKGETYFVNVKLLPDALNLDMLFVFEKYIPVEILPKLKEYYDNSPDYMESFKSDIQSMLNGGVKDESFIEIANHVFMPIKQQFGFESTSALLKSNFMSFVDKFIPELKVKQYSGTDLALAKNGYDVDSLSESDKQILMNKLCNI